LKKEMSNQEAIDTVFIVIQGNTQIAPARERFPVLKVIFIGKPRSLFGETRSLSTFVLTAPKAVSPRRCSGRGVAATHALGSYSFIRYRHDSCDDGDEKKE
jgi:hypothetical protein